jgi:uncharacterized membrane protein YkoI
MSKSIPLILGAALAVCTMAASATGALNATPKGDLASMAKVSMPQARQLALKAYPGKIVKEELEKEKGGSGLRYSFDINDGKVTHEVGIDAKTGSVLENSVEGDND